MNNKSAEIHKNPVCRVISLRLNRFNTNIMKLFDNIVCNCLDLILIITVCNDKIIRDNGNIGNIENVNSFAFFVINGIICCFYYFSIDFQIFS